MTLNKSLGSEPSTLSSPGYVQAWLLARLRAFEAGRIRFDLPNGRTIAHTGARPGPDAVITVVRWRFFWRLLSEGEVGLGRSYVDGDWSSPDIARIFAFGLANMDTLERSAGGWNGAHFVNAIWHRLNNNSLGGSRRNIAAHYDIGNTFYGHWLDGDMNYSSGISIAADETLEQAQARKLDRIVELLALEGGERILEIGCGWGAMARRLTHTEAAHIRCITLSAEQLEYARSAITPNQHDRLDFQIQDYREVEGQFDRVVSIEMLEAVGEKYWPAYFAKLRQCLNADGCAILQVITIADAYFESYRRRPDFIQQYIFPGGMLPTVTIVHAEAERAGLKVAHYEPFGQSYAHTLRHWHERFQRAWPEIQPLGFDDRFRRTWEYYLKYCEEGFMSGQIDVGLFRITVE